MIAIPIYRDNRIRLTGLQRFLFDMKKFFVYQSFQFVLSLLLVKTSQKRKQVETQPAIALQSIDRKTDSLLKVKNIQDSIQLVHRKDSILLKINT